MVTLVCFTHCLLVSYPIFSALLGASYSKTISYYWQF